MHSPIDVLMFGWELPPHNSGGLGVACYGLTHGLSKQGVDISFVMPKKLNVSAPFMSVKFDSIPGVKVTAVNSLLQSYLKAEAYHSLKKELTEEDARVFGVDLYEEALRFGMQAAKWGKRIPHHVIHTHDWMTFPAGIKASEASGRPWIAHVHATEFDRAGDNPDTRVAEIEYEGLNKANQVICVSDFTKQMVKKRYGVEDKKIAVVHNGVIAEEFPPQNVSHLLPHYPMVLFAGRLTMQKGADYFLQAAKRVLEVLPDTLFVIAGSGDLERQLIMQASFLGISHRVLFTGFIRDRNQMAALYQRANVFVMPSVSEPFGIVPLEAMINRRPVIISRQSGVSEVVSHALKTDFWDIDRLANLMVAVIKYPELAVELAHNGHREAQGVTWDKAAKKTISIYRQLIDQAH